MKTPEKICDIFYLGQKCPHLTLDYTYPKHNAAVTESHHLPEAGLWIWNGADNCTLVKSYCTLAVLLQYHWEMKASGLHVGLIFILLHFFFITVRENCCCYFVFLFNLTIFISKENISISYLINLWIETCKYFASKPVNE